MKIKKLSLRNFRGVTQPLEVALDNGQSFLLYGDNGTGKSSLADSIEWFISDKVSQLSGEEVEKNGGLKNVHAKANDPSYVEIHFQNGMDAKKSLIEAKDSLKSKTESTHSSFNKFLSDISKEKIWIRNRDLITFIVDTKGGRLSDISEIIGYEEVAKTKATLKKAENAVRNSIKNRNFESQIAAKKNSILNDLGATVHNPEHFYAAVNALLKKNKFELSVSNKKSLDKAIAELGKGADQAKIIEHQALVDAKILVQKSIEDIQALSPKIVTLSQRLLDIIKNKESFKKLSFSKLYEEASKVLSIHETDDCPLCLQNIDRDALKDIIFTQVATLKEFTKKFDQIDTDKTSTYNSFREVYAEVKNILKILDKVKSETIQAVPKLQPNIQSMEIVGKSLGQKIEEIKTEYLVWDAAQLNSVLNEINADLDAALKKPIDDDNSKKIEIITKIAASERALQDFMNLQKENDFLSNQLSSLSKIASEFNALQSKEMDNFLKAISKDMNDFYLFMNKDEKVEEIELSGVKDSNGEFVGVAVKFKFHGKEVLSPKKYLSESHLNCLGLCLFLSSAKLFNKFSKFLVLDDVISSFDKNHRMRFGQLLVEKFSDYQLLIFTHENEWFDFLTSQVKDKGWRINRTTWDHVNGTSLDISINELRDKIHQKIKSSDADGLGNLLRKFTERLLKNLNNELETPIAFKYNDRNEKRTLDELFSSLRGRLAKKSDISENDVVKRISASQFFANSSSHEGTYTENLADLKAVYADLIAFEELFTCAAKGCGKLVSLQNHNKAKKAISCKCGSKELTWKD